MPSHTPHPPGGASKDLPKLPLGWVAALLVTGAAAAYGMVSTLSLRAELDELKSSILRAPSQEPLAGAEVFLPEENDRLGLGSLEERLATVESRIKKHDRAINVLAVEATRSAGGGDGGALEDGAVTEEMAQALRDFETSERLRKRKERLDKKSAEALAVVSEKHASFVQDHGLSSETDKALSDLEIEAQEAARAIAESVMNGELRWKDVRPEIRATFDDMVGRLHSLLGEDLANDYLSRLEEGLPGLRKMRDRMARGGDSD